jgi:hypothetical protein
MKGHKKLSKKQLSEKWREIFGFEKMWPLLQCPPHPPQLSHSTHKYVMTLLLFGENGQC